MCCATRPPMRCRTWRRRRSRPTRSPHRSAMRASRTSRPPRNWDCRRWTSPCGTASMRRRARPGRARSALNEALRVALDDPAVQKKLVDMGTDLFAPEQRSRAAHAQETGRRSGQVACRGREGKDQRQLMTTAEHTQRQDNRAARRSPRRIPPDGSHMTTDDDTQAVLAGLGISVPAADLPFLRRARQRQRELLNQWSCGNPIGRRAGNGLQTCDR